MNRKSLLSSLSLTVGMSAIFAFGEVASNQSASAETIQLGVSHSEYLPPVHELAAKVALPVHYRNDRLQAESAKSDAAKNASLNGGTQSAAFIDKPVVPATHVAPAPVTSPPISQIHRAPQAPPTLERPIIEWFPIPAHMAGVWTKGGDTTTMVTDLRTGTSQALNQWIPDRMTVTWGHQADKQGNVWHANLLPAERDGSSEGKSVRFLTVSQKLEGTMPDGLLTRTHYIVSEGYGRGQAVDVFQQEALNHYRLIADGQLENNSRNRVFAYQGQPMRDGVLVSTFTRTDGFRPTGTLSGIDLVQSLNDYLRSIGRVDLAP